MYTVEEFRGKGFGKIILDDILAFFRENNVCKVSLNANPKASALYRRAGFENDSQYMAMSLKIS